MPPSSLPCAFPEIIETVIEYSLVALGLAIIPITIVIVSLVRRRRPSQRQWSTVLIGACIAVVGAVATRGIQETLTNRLWTRLALGEGLVKTAEDSEGVEYSRQPESYALGAAMWRIHKQTNFTNPPIQGMLGGVLVAVLIVYLPTRFVRSAPPLAAAPDL